MYKRSGQIIRQKFGEYLLPTVLTSMAISMASVVDGIIVGSLLGEVALAAVGLSGPLIFCINLIYMLLPSAGSPVPPSHWADAISIWRTSSSRCPSAEDLARCASSWW